MTSALADQLVGIEQRYEHARRLWRESAWGQGERIDVYRSWKDLEPLIEFVRERLGGTEPEPEDALPVGTTGSYPGHDGHTLGQLTSGEIMCLSCKEASGQTVMPTWLVVRRWIHSESGLALTNQDAKSVSAQESELQPEPVSDTSKLPIVATLTREHYLVEETKYGWRVLDVKCDPRDGGFS